MQVKIYSCLKVLMKIQIKFPFKYHSSFSFTSSYKWTWTFVISMFDGHVAIILTSFDQFLLIKIDLLKF
jgi:hypothetical protein